MAQEREDLRTQVIINDLLASAARETAIKQTTSKIDNTTDDIKATAEILQNQTDDSLEVVEGEEIHDTLIDTETMDSIRYFEVQTATSTQRLRVIGSEVFHGNLTVKVALQSMTNPCVPVHIYVHANSTATNGQGSGRRLIGMAVSPQKAYVIRGRGRRYCSGYSRRRSHTWRRRSTRL